LPLQAFAKILITPTNREFHVLESAKGYHYNLVGVARFGLTLIIKYSL